MRRGTDTAVLLPPRPLPGHEFLVPIREVGFGRWGERRHRQEGERHDALGGGERGDGGGGGGYGVELALLCFLFLFLQYRYFGPGWRGVVAFWRFQGAWMEFFRGRCAVAKSKIVIEMSWRFFAWWECCVVQEAARGWWDGRAKKFI